MGKFTLMSLCVIHTSDCLFCHSFIWYHLSHLPCSKHLECLPLYVRKALNNVHTCTQYTCILYMCTLPHNLLGTALGVTFSGMVLCPYLTHHSRHTLLPLWLHSVSQGLPVGTQVGILQCKHAMIMWLSLSVYYLIDTLNPILS